MDIAFSDVLRLRHRNGRVYPLFLMTGRNFWIAPPGHIHMAIAAEQLVQNVPHICFFHRRRHESRQNILHTIGNTPHVRINRLFGPGANVWVKSERSNPGGSIKDHIALAMVENTPKNGLLKARRRHHRAPHLATPASAWRSSLPSRATN